MSKDIVKVKELLHLILYAFHPRHITEFGCVHSTGKVIKKTYINLDFLNKRHSNLNLESLFNCYFKSGDSAFALVFDEHGFHHIYHNKPECDASHLKRFVNYLKGWDNE